MASELSMPDFDDLLAAYDIPDVTVRIREATAEDDLAPDDADGSNDKPSSGNCSPGNVEGGSTASSVANNDELLKMQTDDSPTDSITDPQLETQSLSNQSEQMPGLLKETSNVSETSIIQTQDGLSNNVSRITFPISALSSRKEPQTIKLKLPAGVKNQKLVIQSILAPASTTAGFEFKNTSSDGTKILNVSGGVGSLIAVPSSTAVKTPKNGQGVANQISTQASQPGSGPPAIFRGTTCTATLSNSTVSVAPVYKSSFGPLYRISKVQGSQTHQASSTVKASQADPYEEEIRQLGKKQLERANPIHTYSMRPPPEELGLDIPVGGYKCLECGDSYALKSSLTQHMVRRSVKILITCSFCRCKLEFYNKCSMHAHMRGHNLVNMKPVLDAVVSPLDTLSFDQHQGRPKRETNKQSSDQEQGKDGKTVKSLLQQARQLLEDRLPKKVPNLSIPNLLLESRNTSSCPVCGVHVGSAVSALAAHFQTVSASQQYGCKHCQMVLVNYCQLKIHMKVHASFPPWLCPECAKRFTNYVTFEEHINQECLHFNRSACFQCGLCSRVQNSLADYKVHLSTVHKNCFYKCLSCQLAFRSVDALKLHSSAKHNNLLVPRCSIITKCPLCDTVFTQNSMLDSHLRTHLKTFMPLKFHFVCSECPCVFSEIEDLHLHNKLIHNNRYWWYCDLCQHKFKSRQTAKAHRSTKHQAYASLNFTPSTDNVTALPNGTDQKDKNAYASVVVDKVITDNGANAKATPNDEKKESTKVIIKRMLRCPGCTAFGVDIYFKKERNLRNHIVRSHPNIDPNSIRAESLEYVPFYPGKKNVNIGDQDESGGTDVQVGHKRKHQRDAEASVNRIKRLREARLFCAKCDFESKDRIVFGSHIDNHRENDGVSQCQECGVCFRVEDSLRKHLFVSHQIRDIEGYAKFQKEVQESIEKFRMEKMKDMSECQDKPGSPANPLECKVCHKVMDNDAMMKTHVRSHGMAFIQTKKQINVGDKEKVCI